MAEQVSYIDMLKFSVVAIRKQPVHATVFVGISSLIFCIYYLLVQSEPGQALLAQLVISDSSPPQSNLLGLVALLLVFFAVAIVISAGAHRLILGASSSPWWPFRLGRDELNILLISLCLVIFCVGLAILFALFFGLIIVLLSLVVSLGSAESATGFRIIASTIMTVSIFVILLYTMGRFFVALPLSILEKQFVLNVWRASDIHDWKLFGANLTLLVFSYLIQFLLLLVLVLAGFLPGFTGEATDSSQIILNGLSSPYGAFVVIAVPIQAVLGLMAIGPSAALAQWAHANPEVLTDPYTDVTED